MGENSKLLVIIASTLEKNQKEKLLGALGRHKSAIAWKISNIRGINPCFCTNKILIENNMESKVQHQRRLNPNMMDVVKIEVKKLMDVGVIYAILDSSWVSLDQVVPKKVVMTVVLNENDELILTHTHSLGGESA